MNEDKIVTIFALDCPYPPNHGGRLDVFNRASALAAAGFDVTVFCCSDNDAEIGLFSISGFKVDCRKRNRSFIQLFSIHPFQYLSRKSALSGYHIVNSGALLIAESEYLFPFLNKYSQSNLRVVRQHNVEWNYLFGLFRLSKSVGEKLYLGSEFIKTFSKRSSLMSGIEEWCISDSENALLIALNRSTEAIYVPTCFPESTFGVGGRGDAFCFVGRLDGPDSKAVAQWYRKNLQARLSAIPHFRMIFAGRMKGECYDKLIHGYNELGETIVNPVNLDEIYAQSLGMIVPIFGQSSGVKMKVVEAFCSGLEVITTPAGASGLSLDVLQTIFVCSTAAEFYTAVSRCIAMSNDERNQRRHDRLIIAKSEYSESRYVSFVNNRLAAHAARWRLSHGG